MNGVIAWGQPLVLLVCGVICAVRAQRFAAERMPWRLIGAGLVLYAAGYVVAFGAGPAAVPLITALYDGARGFPYLFWVLAAIAVGTLLAAVTLAMQARSA